MEIALLTAYDNTFEKKYQWVEKVATQKAIYCDLHGYDFIIRTEGFDSSRPASWSKIVFLKSVLENYDWVFWSDADAAIMNHHIKLESFIDNDFDIVIGSDPNGINCGNFLVKNSAWCHDFLDRVYQQEQWINHMWWEQKAMMELFDPVHFKVVSQELFNCNVNKFSGKNFMVHFPGENKNVFIKEFEEEIC